MARTKKSYAKRNYYPNQEMAENAAVALRLETTNGAVRVVRQVTWRIMTEYCDDAKPRPSRSQKDSKPGADRLVKMMQAVHPKAAVWAEPNEFWILRIVKTEAAQQVARALTANARAKKEAKATAAIVQKNSPGRRVWIEPAAPGASGPAWVVKSELRDAAPLALKREKTNKEGGVDEKRVARSMAARGITKIPPTVLTRPGRIRATSDLSAKYQR